MDAHVHLRTPGGEHKEDFSTGSQAALAGGFATVLAMPNTDPPITTVKLFREVLEKARKEALCDVFLFAGASPETIDQLPELSHQAVALKIFMNQTYGPLRVDNPRQALDYYRKWESDKPIALHAEDEMIELGLRLAAETGKRTHFCHISRKRDIELIAKAKLKGLPITCEVTPHHLFLRQEDLKRLGNLGDMRPVLGTQEDVEALWEHLGTTVDCIASDHAPHTLEEKRSMQSPPGVPGLETTLPLLLNAVNENKLSLDRMIELLSTNPKHIYGIAEQKETWIEADFDREWVIGDEALYTKCKWTPFQGKKVKGKLLKVIFKGKEVFSEGKFSVTIQ